MEYLNLDSCVYFRDMSTKDTVFPEVRLNNLKRLRIKAPEHDGMIILKALGYPHSVRKCHGHLHE